jgi:hypothetical protein
VDGDVWADFFSPDADAVIIRCWRSRGLLLAVDKVILRDQQIMVNQTTPSPGAIGGPVVFGSRK